MSESKTTTFPKNFRWGVAAASYQIEGAAAEDGKGPSVWDMFTRKEGVIWKNQNGDIACDHYHRWRDDIRLMKELGIRNNRFSISWPRVLPDGVGPVNQKGLDFYQRLVDEMIACGIEPWLTLFHWDYPLALYRRGGWLNRDSADWFAEYTRLIVSQLSDRVSHWMTLNEPQCFIELGLGTGYHAPGDKLRREEVLLGAHHTMMAHGKAVQIIRAEARSKPIIGIANANVVHIPATESAADIEATRKGMFRPLNRNLFTNTWWCDPFFLGKYPEDGIELFGNAVPKIHSGDMETICQKLDFHGLNIYHGWQRQAGPDGEPVEVPLAPGYPKTTSDYWPVEPRSLYWGPRFFYERYQVPIIITENGHQNADVVSLDGQVHDPQRIDYLHRYLMELRRAIRDGIPVQGYFQWCFTDNFEWAFGDAIRVGIVFTDYPNQRRIPKDSAHWYRGVIETNGANL